MKRALSVALGVAVVMGTQAALVVPPSIAAGEPAVVAPSAPTFDLDTADQDPGNFVISNFGDGDPTVTVSVGFVDPPSGTSFGLPTRTGLTAGFGYDLSSTSLTEASFSGSVSDANAALAAMTVSTGSTAGNITIRVTATRTEKEDVFYNPINGHFYQFVQADSGVYAYYPTNESLSAVHLAEDSTLFGVRGYLATVTDAQEQTFVFENVDGSDIWMGGSDGYEPLKERVAGFTAADEQADTEGKWYWIAGPDAGTQFWNGAAASASGWVDQDNPKGASSVGAHVFLGPTVEGNISEARYENWCHGNAGQLTWNGSSFVLADEANFSLKVRGSSPRATRQEPNDSGAEHYLLEKWSGAPCWNDWGSYGSGTKRNYLVEYSQNWGDVSADAGDWDERRGSFSTLGTDFFASSTVTAKVDRAVKNVTVVPTATSATVSWAAPSSGTVTGYEVTAIPGAHSCTTTPPATSCEVTGLSPLVEYSFTVEATFSSGDPSVSLAVTDYTLSSLDGCGTLKELDSDSYTLRSDASATAGTIELTPKAGTKKGAVWSVSRVSLASDFCVTAELYLGDSDSGADGLAFVLQPASVAELSSGGGLGYAGINPSFAVELDTYTNSGTAPRGDPVESGKDEDHIALMKDGDTGLHSAWGADPINFTSSIENDEWYPFSFQWDASEAKATVYFDQQAQFSAVSADLETYFSSSSAVVYWGFTAATGGSINQQQVRNIQFSATERTNTGPSFVGPASSRTVLLGSSNTIDFTLSDDSTTQDQWRVGSSPTVSDSSIFGSGPSFVMTGPTTARLTFEADASTQGTSTVALVVTDADGASATHTFTLTVSDTLPVTSTDRRTQTSSSDPVVVTPPALQPRAFTPPQLATAPVQSGPVLRGGVPPTPPSAPQVSVGGRTAAVETEVPTLTRMDVSLRGGFNLGVNVLEDQGQITKAPDGTTEIVVRNGASASLSGSGFRPGATVQVFMPLQGDNAKELTRIPVNADGSFDGSAAFATRQNEVPLPIGKNVLQLVSLQEDGNQVVVEMAVNIAQGAPAPEFNRIEGVIPAMTPGQSIATSGGEPVPVTVTPVAEQKLALVEGDGWTMAINVASETGGVEPSEGGALLKLVRNDTTVVSGSGFMPGTRADVWLFSDPTLLGTVTIDENGEFTGEMNIDANMVPVGEHTLQLQGVGEDGYVKAANMGVLVDDPVEAMPTAVESAGWLLWWVAGAFLLLLLVVLFVIAARRRRA